MQLFYETGYDKSYLNGRIAGIKWRTKGSSDELRSYGYVYDFAGRLKMADFVEQLASNPNNATTNTWDNNFKDFTTSNIAYDENGNIQSMKHMGLNASKQKTVVDDLTYSYASNSNILNAVTENNSGNSRLDCISNTVHDGLEDFREPSGSTTSSTDYTYDANGNLSSDDNRNVISIDNNWFTINKPLHVRYSQTQFIDYIYDATGNLLRKNVTQQINGNSVTKQFDYVDQVVLEDGKRTLISHDEGRVRVNSTNVTPTFSYDYYIKDHISNIRCIITEESVTGMDQFSNVEMNPGDVTQSQGGGSNGTGVGTNDPNVVADDPMVYLATSEIANNDIENALFENISSTRDIKPGSSDLTDQSSAKLTATTGKVVGPGLMLKVMAGDAIQLGSQSLFFSNTQPSQPVSIQGIVTSIVGALTGEVAGLNDAIGAATQNANYINTTDLSDLLNTLHQNNDQDTTPTCSYLNYIMFDEALNLIPNVSGAIKISQSPEWTNNDVPKFQVTQNGYFYAFTSNQCDQTVRTDNMYIMHWQGRLLEEFNYYPFGLTFDVTTNTTVQKSSIKYNSQCTEQNEFTDASGNSYGINLYDFAARSYDMQIGRWMQPDPMMQYASPYLAMGNNPTSFTDPLGLEDYGGPIPRFKTKVYADKDGNIIVQAPPPEKGWLNNTGGGGMGSGDGSASIDVEEGVTNLRMPNYQKRTKEQQDYLEYKYNIKEKFGARKDVVRKNDLRPTISHRITQTLLVNNKIKIEGFANATIVKGNIPMELTFSGKGGKYESTSIYSCGGVVSNAADGTSMFGNKIIQGGFDLEGNLKVEITIPNGFDTQIGSTITINKEAMDNFYSAIGVSSSEELLFGILKAAY